MYSQFSVRPLLYLCCSTHVLRLYIICSPVFPLKCSYSASPGQEHLRGMTGGLKMYNRGT